MVELRAGDAGVLVDPTLGGSLVSIEVAGHELLVPPNDNHVPVPTSGSFLMAPWVGHLSRGVLSFRGRTHLLPLNDGEHAIHGLVFDVPWQVEAVRRDSVLLRRALVDPWPFGGTVHQEIHLEPSALHLVAEVASDKLAMPSAVGWHPWFLPPEAGRALGRVTASNLLEHDENDLPTGALAPVEGDTDLRDRRTLAEKPIDVVYVGASSPMELGLPDLDLRIHFDPLITTVVVYTPPGAICLEPWSSWPDANRLENDGYRTGLVVLEPGESLQRWARWEWTVPQTREPAAGGANRR
jgi:galactose mutarotase-like enzyme